MLSEAKAMLSEAEREKHDVARKTEALDLKIRAQAEKAAEEAAEREAERAAELRRSRAALKASARRERERDGEDSDAVSQYHDAPETVGGGTSARRSARRNDMDAREARLREETTRVEAERATLSALREGAIVAALGGSGGCVFADARRAAAADTRAAAARGAERQHPRGFVLVRAASARGAERAERRARRRGGPGPGRGRAARASEVERARAVTEAEATRARARRG